MNDRQPAAYAGPDANGRVSIGLVGCGAIAARFHLPALLRRLDPDSLVLVDPDRGRASTLGEPLGITRIAHDIEEVLSDVRGVVLATPPHLHFTLGMQALGADLALLSEKPLAENSSDAEALVLEAESRNGMIAVNNTRRFFPVLQKFKELCQSMELGRLLRIDAEHGEAFDWPCAPGSYFGRYGRGRGVLLDLGAHVLDLVSWWVDATPHVKACRHDSLGGTEAYAEVEAESNGVEIQVKLSWLSKLRNSVILEFERGIVEANSHDRSEYTYRRGSSSRRVRLPALPPSRLADAVVGNFIDSIQRATPPAVSGRDVLPGLRFLDACYARANRRDMQWYDRLEAYRDA